MTIVDELWRPFHDEPLFVPELLHGPDAVPDRLRDRIVDYLCQVAAARRAPLHTCTAFNALHFGFDLHTHGYRAELLDPELFVLLSSEQQKRPALPVGTFTHVDRGGRRSLLAEVIARYGVDPRVDTDGWVPASLSGAPSGQLDDGDGVHEKVVLDVEAFGAPLTAAEHGELHRLRRRGPLLDGRGHLHGTFIYPSGVDVRDDVALYCRHLLGPARGLLLSGPLGGLLTEPTDEYVLAAALHQAMATIGTLLDSTDRLRRWQHYAVEASRFARHREDGWPGLSAGHLDEVVRSVSRTGTQPQYTGVWPLLTAQVAHDIDDDPLELTSTADLIVHTNLLAADLAASATDGLLPGGTHLRIDDAWQAGGVWRTQHQPIPANLLATDPRTPLGLGHQPVTAAVPPEHDESVVPPTPQPPPEASPAENDGEPDTASPDILDLVVIRDSLVVYTVALREQQWEDGELPLAEPAAAVLAGGPLLLELHHDGEQLDTAEQLQPVERDDTTLHGIAWPWSFYAGIKLTVAVARHAARISITTTLLDHPLPFGDQYRWDANLAILAASLGAEPPATPPDHEEPELPLPADTPPRQRGVAQLHGLIIAALRRHGTQGAFGSRRLTGPRLLAALFGPDLVAPPLMWEVIYTCDRLVDAGKLTCEPPTSNPDRTGGSPDVYAWWPDNDTRRQAEHPRTGTTTSALLAGKIREYWVPPFCRLLPAGQQASDQARQAYAAWIVKVRGPDTDTTLPSGYTFVRGAARGSSDPDSLLRSIAPQPGARST